MNTIPQPAVDAAKEIMNPFGVWSEEYSLRMIDWFAAIIARHYAPLVALREDQMQALGLPDDDHTVIADEIRRIRDEGRKHFHDVTRLTERVEVLQNLLASAGKYADEFRKERDALRSKYASAEADGNSLREDREKLIARVTELEAERNDARRHWADTQHIAANLKLKVAELEKDRDRLDWLCDNPVQEISFGQFPQSIIFNGECFIDVRAAIDAARAKEDAT